MLFCIRVGRTVGNARSVEFGKTAAKRVASAKLTKLFMEIDKPSCHCTVSGFVTGKGHIT